MGDLIRHADTSIPGLPRDVAGADVPGELKELIESCRMYAGQIDALDEDLLMQRLCSFVVSVQHVALLEGMKRK